MKGEGFVKVTSILMIVGGIIAAIAGVIAVLGLSALAAIMGSAEDMGLLFAATILVAVASVIQIVAGIKGLIACKVPEGSGGCIIFGAIIATLSLVSMVINLIAGGKFSFLSLVINLMVPVLYIYGAIHLKNGVADTKPAHM